MQIGHMGATGHLEDFSSLVERIYDCALEPALWPETLEAITADLDGCGANLFSHRIDKPSVVLFHSFGEDEAYTELYKTTYAPLNPLFPASSFLEVGTIHSVFDIVPRAQFCESRMYLEWVRPQGMLDCLYTNLERSRTSSAAMSVRRQESKGLYDEAAKARFALIAPHVRRAVAIGHVVERYQASEEALSRTLDRLESAVVLVDADGRLVHVNEAATAMLSDGGVLRAPRGRVTAADPRADRELQQAIAEAAREGAAPADLRAKNPAVRLAMDETGSQVAHVLSLAPGARRDLLGTRALVALFVQTSAFHTPAPLEIVSQVYGLTAGEMRVLDALSQASGVATMARALGVSADTVKTHLRQLFSKTGTSRQADLIKLLARHASPLRP